MRRSQLEKAHLERQQQALAWHRDAAQYARADIERGLNEIRASVLGGSPSREQAAAHQRWVKRRSPRRPWTVEHIQPHALGCAVREWSRDLRAREALAEGDRLVWETVLDLEPLLWRYARSLFRQGAGREEFSLMLEGAYMGVLRWDPKRGALSTSVRLWIRAEIEYTRTTRQQVTTSRFGTKPTLVWLDEETDGWSRADSILPPVEADADIRADASRKMADVMAVVEHLSARQRDAVVRTLLSHESDADVAKSWGHRTRQAVQDARTKALAHLRAQVEEA